MNNIGLQLLSLYKDIKDSQKMINEKFNTTTVEGMVKSISLALERGNYDEAYTLLGDWTMKFPLENEDGLQYYYLYIKTYLQEMDSEKDRAKYLNLLNNAIDTANTFFFVNSYDGKHAMDNEACELYHRLNKIIVSLNDEELNDNEITGLEFPGVFPERLNPIVPMEINFKSIINRHLHIRINHPNKLNISSNNHFYYLYGIICKHKDSRLQ